MILWKILWRGSIHSTNNYMVSLVWFQRNSFNGSELLILESLNFWCIHKLGGFCGVNAWSFNGNDKVSSIFHKVRGVQSKNSSLIGLSDVGKNDVDHWHEHSVLLGVSSVLDDWNNIGSFLGHVHQVSTWSLGELHSVDATSWTYEVSDVRHCGATCCTNIENLRPRFHVNLTNSANYCRCNFWPKRVPDSVLCLGGIFLVLKNN